MFKRYKKGDLLVDISDGETYFVTHIDIDDDNGYWYDLASTRPPNLVHTAYEDDIAQYYRLYVNANRLWAQLNA